MRLLCQMFIPCLVTGLIFGCTRGARPHQHSRTYSLIAENNVTVEIEALREEIAIAQPALAKLTNSLSVQKKAGVIKDGVTAREKFYPVASRYQDLLTELEILKRRVEALRTEREQYEKSLLLHR